MFTFKALKQVTLPFLALGIILCVAALVLRSAKLALLGVCTIVMVGVPFFTALYDHIKYGAD
jgi:hypothetical protein